MSPKSSTLEALAYSGWWTAAARALESLRTDRLFNDVWAAVLVGLDVLIEFHQNSKESGSDVADHLAVMTRFFDDYLLYATKVDGVRQVVVVASGLDARAFRLNWPPETHLFELEQPSVLAYKDRRFSQIGATARCRRHVVGVDLNEPWSEALCQSGFVSSDRSVWLLEGFLYFLPKTSIDIILDTITALTPAGSRLALDIVNSEMLISPSTRHWSSRLSAAGMPWRFTSDDPKSLLCQNAWKADVIQPGEDGAHYGRFLESFSKRKTELSMSSLITAVRR